MAAIAKSCISEILFQLVKFFNGAIAEKFGETGKTVIWRDNKQGLAPINKPPFHCADMQGCIASNAIVLL